MTHTARLFVLILAGCLATPAFAQFVPADEDVLAITIVDQPASYNREWSDSRTELTADARCSPHRLRKADATFRWKDRRTEVTGYRVDVTGFRTGFARGDYLTSGELPAGRTTIDFPDGLPGVYYYWRVLAKTPDGWKVVGAGRYHSPVCPADGVDEGVER